MHTHSVKSTSCVLLNEMTTLQAVPLVTYVWDVGSLVLSEFLVVAQEEDGVLQGEGVVKVALGLALRRALHLQADRGGGCWVRLSRSVSCRCSPIDLQELLTFSSSARKLSRVSSDSLPTSNMVTAWLFRF